jgi:hypothetical protein
MVSRNHLAEVRLTALGDQLYSGDEWDLVDLRPEDLGLPASTCQVRILTFGYNGDLRQTGQEQQSPDEVTVEYAFKVTLTFEAEMSRADADAHGWDHQPTPDGLALIEGDLQMTGTVGVDYEGDEVTAPITYISLARSDGTPGHPLAPKPGVGPGARILAFPTSSVRAGVPGPRNPT